MIVAGCALLWLAWPQIVRPDTEPGTSAKPATGLVAGEILSIQGIEWPRDRDTLVMFLQSSCKFCTASMEFYRSLLQTGSNVQLVVVGREPLPALLEYLTFHKFKPERVQFLEKPIPGVTGTPILILVDSSGRVRDSWRGQMDGSQEARLRQLMTTAPLDSR